MNADFCGRRQQGRRGRAGGDIAANKVPGVRAALCADAYTAGGARKWNDANVLALSLRLTSDVVLDEILDAWFAGRPSDDPSDLANISHLEQI
ncbi:RpiB/LacA/LacB family sugar-phosphate isomerase [Nonomuraea wenchangensis]|uniref:RpiB/LacA/LacB family sugar-phosphate isomerase n=1 Tax=Nonomuraea wenchangensis TaxID=568860 RepID=UPI00378B21CD